MVKDVDYVISEVRNAYEISYEWEELKKLLNKALGKE
jgi:hypothetical protein